MKVLLIVSFIVLIYVVAWSLLQIAQKLVPKRKGKKELHQNLSSSHGLYKDESYVPDWIYDEHYDCGDKD